MTTVPEGPDYKYEFHKTRGELQKALVEISHLKALLRRAATALQDYTSDEDFYGDESGLSELHDELLEAAE